MKHLSTIALLFITGCTGFGKKDNVNMTGVYKMLSQSVKSSKTDTSYKSLLQLKIFTNNYVMFANVNPPDTGGSFGIGKYTVSEDTVYESIFFRSSDTLKVDTISNYKLGVEKTTNGYKQMIPEFTYRGQKYTLIEDYESVGTQNKSLLDGVWKLSKAYIVNGKDTVPGNQTQYKIYNAGYFIWGQSFSDSSHKNQTGIGYGSFKLNGNKLTEYLTVSTNAGIRGFDVGIDTEMNGTDEFKQTITSKDGSKSVEVYERLK